MKNSMLVAIILVVVVVLAVGGFLILNNNGSQTNNIQTTNNTVTPTPVTTPNTTGTSAKVDVSIKNMSFPSSTTVNKGQTVVWTNNDSTVHTVTFDDGSANSGTIAVGGTFTHTFSTT